MCVHGLTGNLESTWTDKSTGIAWPEALLKNDLPQSRIVTFGYDADIVHFWSMAAQNRIGNHAQTLINVLAQMRERTETEERPIIFVAHSLGGLVVEDVSLIRAYHTLSQNKERATETYGSDHVGNSCIQKQR